MNVLEELRAKAGHIDTGTSAKETYYALFSARGFTPELELLAETDDHLLLSC